MKSDIPSNRNHLPSKAEFSRNRAIRIGIMWTEADPDYPNLTLLQIFLICCIQQRILSFEREAILL